MPFIIVCVDKENPARSEVVPDEDVPDTIDEPTSLVFKSQADADKWIKKDEKEFPGVYDYHILEV